MSHDFSSASTSFGSSRRTSRCQRFADAGHTAPAGRDGEWEFNERDLSYTVDMMQDFLEDETNGEANKEVMQGWLAEWVPYSVAAAKGLEPIWSEPEVQPVTFEESFSRARSRFEGILSDFGLQVPEEVTL